MFCLRLLGWLPPKRQETKEERKEEKKEEINEDGQEKLLTLLKRHPFGEEIFRQLRAAPVKDKDLYRLSHDQFYAKLRENKDFEHLYAMKVTNRLIGPKRYNGYGKNDPFNRPPDRFGYEGEESIPIDLFGCEFIFFRNRIAFYFCL